MTHCARCGKEIMQVQADVVGNPARPIGAKPSPQDCQSISAALGAAVSGSIGRL